MGAVTCSGGHGGEGAHISRPSAHFSLCCCKLHGALPFARVSLHILTATGPQLAAQAAAQYARGRLSQRSVVPAPSQGPGSSGAGAGQHSPAARPAPLFLVAANLYNSREVLPNMIHQLLQLVLLMPPGWVGTGSHAHPASGLPPRACPPRPPLHRCACYTPGSQQCKASHRRGVVCSACGPSGG
jgi:hypothetical protein